MILLGISGGAFYLEAMAEGAFIASQHLTPTHYIGSSSGAIITVVMAAKGAEYMINQARKIDPKKAFKVIPFNKDGKITLRALWRVARGKSPALQDARPILRQLISKKEYYKYRASNKPEAFVLMGDVDNGCRFLVNLKTEPNNYNEFIDMWETSTQMQGMTEGRMVRGRLCWDGGQFDHNPTHLLASKANTICSIWSRPKRWVADYKEMGCKGYMGKLMRMIELDNIEKSLNDEALQHDICEDNGIKEYNIYTQRHLTHFYSTDRTQINKSIQSTILSAKQTFKI